MIRYRFEERDGQFGCLYRFEMAGERLPEHTHDTGEGHAVACLRGAVMVRISPADVIYLAAGEEATFDGTLSHTVEASVPDCLTFHRFETRPPLWRDILGTGDLEA